MNDSGGVLYQDVRPTSVLGKYVAYSSRVILIRPPEPTWLLPASGLFPHGLIRVTYSSSMLSTVYAWLSAI